MLEIVSVLYLHNVQSIRHHLRHEGGSQGLPKRLYYIELVIPGADMAFSAHVLYPYFLVVRTLALFDLQLLLTLICRTFRQRPFAMSSDGCDPEYLVL